MKQRIFLLALPLLLALSLSQWQRGNAQAAGDEPAAPAPVKAGLQPTARRDAPLSLTASDGTGLRLVDLTAQAVVEGPLAFTELRLTFENPQDRVLEGRFQITLPDQAAISRFAMKIEGNWQEAEVVELQAARVAYEDFLHRRQDPALMEKAAGNEFSARIFPIPAKGRKELILSYSQEIPDGTYRLPLQGLPEIANLNLGVKVSASASDSSLQPEIQSVRRENYRPEGDFVVSGGPQSQALRAGDYVVAKVRPQVSAAATAPLDNLLVLVDTSASRALGQAEQGELVSDLLRGMPQLKSVKLAAFDQTVVPLYDGAPAGFKTELLNRRQALGATNLESALRWAAAQKGATRLLLVSDGVTTAGSDRLKEALKSGSLKRLDVVLVGGIRDKSRVESLVGDGLAQDGLVLDGDLGAREIARRLALGVSSGVDVGVKDALWVWPSTLDNLQPGDQRLIYAQLKPGQKTFDLSLSGQPVALQPSPSTVPALLQRQATVARIARLESVWKDAASAEQTKIGSEIVKLSTEHRVLSDKTALLVLETEADYFRFGIDRKALADILVVGPKGLEVKTRDDIVLAEAKKTDYKVAQSHTGGPADANGSATSDVVFDSDDAPATAAPSNRPSALPSASTALPVETTVGAAPEGMVAAEPAPSRPMAAPRREMAPADEERSRRAATDDSLYLTALNRETEAPAHPWDVKSLPLTGPSAEITLLLQAGKKDEALSKARAWQAKEPGNVLALIALGQALEATGNKAEAARAYGSIIDLFPARADLRRYAGSRLESLGKDGLALAVDSFEKAVAQRPDHVSSHRFLALALARQGDYEAAFSALEKGLKQDYPSGRFLSYERILRNDLGIMGAAWIASKPAAREAVLKRLAASDTPLATQPSLRFVLTWETDANDVDFHIHDGQGGHAYYSSPQLPSGGELYGDVTTGYGPECFAIDGEKLAYPYRLQIHYYRRGPMGYGMGQLEVLQHDGKGGLSFEERPYLVMQDGAYVDLGIVEQALPTAQR